MAQDDSKPSTQRWAGRNSDKDQLRHRIWSRLESEGASIQPPWSSIPNFQGAAKASFRLQEVPGWRHSRIVKSNPDKPQAWIRLAALQQGKRLYMPVPELVNNFPYVLLDPLALKEQDIAFEDVMFSEGAVRFGKRVEFSEVEPMDFFVVGSVAVTRAGGRTGKGAGFADLEFGIFQSYGLIKPSTAIATSVHDIQLVADDQVVMQSHDTPLDWIATPTELICTETKYPVPGPVNWDALQEDQYEKIPFLNDLRAELSQ